MKIWEMEDNREFECTDRGAFIYKIENNKIYYRNDNAQIWSVSHVPYNTVAELDFVYLPEKEYYLVMKPEMKYQSEFDILNWDIGEKAFYFSNEYGNEAIKTQFTDYEIERMVPKLYLDICNKEEVGEWNDNSR